MGTPHILQISNLLTLRSYQVHFTNDLIVPSRFNLPQAEAEPRNHGPDTATTCLLHDLESQSVAANICAIEAIKSDGQDLYLLYVYYVCSYGILPIRWSNAFCKQLLLNSCPTPGSNLLLQT